MQSGLVYLLQSLVDLYLMVVALRLAMQWVRADFRNPIVRFVISVTDPLVKPLQKMLAPMYKIDTATLVVFMAIQAGVIVTLTSLTCLVMPDAITLLWLAIIRGMRLILNVYFFVIFAYVLMGWIAPSGYNPSLAMLNNMLRELAQPVLQPVQRLIPAIGGLDLSALFLLLGLSAVTRMLLSPAQQIANGYLCSLAAYFSNRSGYCSVSSGAGTDSTAESLIEIASGSAPLMAAAIAATPSALSAPD